MIRYNKFTLSNGLRVIHHHDPHTPMVAINILYNVGSRDESPELTGMAHLFEHLMFGGSRNIPEYDKAIENAGGWNNAWTSNDFTNFYDVAPAVNAETLFWLESDRMLELAFSDKALEVQRSVVSEEFKQVCLNQPYGDLMHHLRRLLYSTHPYRYPTIGKELSHIEKVTQYDVKNFFFSHYAPNNAVLAVAGDITFNLARELAEKWFGPIPSREIAPRLYSPEPPRTAPTADTIHAAVPQTMLVVAYPMAPYNSPDYIPGDIITDLLASGRSARFHQNLVMKHPIFVQADAAIAGHEEPGFLMLNAALADSDPARVKQAIDLMTAEASRLAAEGITQYELDRAVNRFESNHTFSSLSYLAKAQQLAMAEMHNEDINSIVTRYRNVTPADIKRVATDIFNPSTSATLVYSPQ